MDKTLFADVLGFLRKNFVAVLATSYLNLPFASSIYYIVDEKLNFFFITKPNAEKSINLRHNKNVALVIGMGPGHISVQARGHATILHAEKERKAVIREIESMLKKNGVKDSPIRVLRELQSKNKDADSDYVYKVVPQHLSFFNLDDKDFPASISDRKHVIIPHLKRLA